jgi:hypothetical protein
MVENKEWKQIKLNFCQPIIGLNFLMDTSRLAHQSNLRNIMRAVAGSDAREFATQKVSSLHPLSLVFQLLFLPLSSSREIASKVLRSPVGGRSSSFEKGSATSKKSISREGVQCRLIHHVQNFPGPKAGFERKKTWGFPK